jgi:hypothetical protein
VDHDIPGHVRGRAEALVRASAPLHRVTDEGIMSSSDKRSTSSSAGSPPTDAQRPYVDRLWSALRINEPMPGALGHGLPMPRLHRPQESNAMHYSVTAIDSDGRLAARSALMALGWRPGLAVDVSAIQGVLVVMPQEDGAQAINRQGHLRLPASVRHLSRLGAGDRLLLAACRDYPLLLAYPVAAIDAMVLTYHLGASL